MLIFGQKACFLGPTIFEIPQPNWYYKLHASLSVPLNGLKIEKGIYYILLPSTRKKGQNDGLPLSASDRPHDSWAKKDQKTCFSWNGHRIIKTESVKKINAVYITRSGHFFFKNVPSKRIVLQVQSTWVSEEYIQAQNFLFACSTTVCQKASDMEILKFHYYS